MIRRAATALVAIPSLLAALWAIKHFQQPWALALLLSLVTGLAGWEYAELVRGAKIRLARASFALVSMLAIAAYGMGAEGYAPLIFAAAVVVILVRHLLQPQALQSVAAGVLGLFYLPYLLQFAYAIFETGSGFVDFATLLALVWAYDTGAFFTGSRWGKRLLMPQVSPQKTWEGAVGGWGLALMVALTAHWWSPWTPPFLTWIPHAVLIALLVSLFAQCGDLFESMLKRAAGVKDSGALFPGHGGMLDRLDAFLFALPAFYVYLRYVDPYLPFVYN